MPKTFTEEFKSSASHHAKGRGDIIIRLQENVADRLLKATGAPEAVNPKAPSQVRNLHVLDQKSGTNFVSELTEILGYIDTFPDHVLEPDERLFLKRGILDVFTKSYFSEETLNNLLRESRRSDGTTTTLGDSFAMSAAGRAVLILENPGTTDQISKAGLLFQGADDLHARLDEMGTRVWTAVEKLNDRNYEAEIAPVKTVLRPVSS